MDGQIVIWGTGRLAKGFGIYINTDNVIAFVDSNRKEPGAVFMNRPVILPEELGKMTFDRLVLLVSKRYDEIYRYATEQLRIDKNKILYWSQYYGYYQFNQTLACMVNSCKENGSRRLMDRGFHLQKNHVYSCENLEIWGCGDRTDDFYPVYEKLYSRIYPGWDDIPKEECPDAVFAGRILCEEDRAVLEKELPHLRERFRYVYFTLPYPDTEQNCSLQDITIKENNAVKGAETKVWKLWYEQLICVETEQRRNIKLFIACHKAFRPPENKLYIPLWLGASEKNIYHYQEDKQEPSIPHLNPLLNEGTGLYWMWQHADCDYIGLVHYRRYFLDDSGKEEGRLLGEERINAIFHEYDMITAPLLYFPISVYEQLRITVEPEAFDTGYRLIKNIIEEKQPEYAEAFQYVMNGHAIFPYNMFIAGKGIFDSYCEWLFSIVVEAAEKIDVSEYSAYSKRIIGFFAERLLTVWLVKQSLRIKEMNVWTTEPLEDQNTDISRLHGK